MLLILVKNAYSGTLKLENREMDLIAPTRESLLDRIPHTD